MLSKKFTAVAGAASADSDPNFSSVSLLLAGDGTNGAQNNTFLDSSTNNFSITRNGNVTQGSFSPYSASAPYSASTKGGSVYFDGAGDHLVTPSNAALGFGTGDFTVECWYYHLSRASTDGLLSPGTANLNIYIDTSGTLGYFNGSSGQASSQTVPLNAWGHIALVRSSGTIKMYYNGVQVLSQTNTTNFATTYWIAGTNALADNDPCNGYMTDARLVKGTAVYTTAFTPPTAPLTAISGTSLLLNYTNAGIPDSAMMNDLETVGGAQISTSVKKYGTGSMYFDGSGDYLAAPSMPSNTMGTGDFTIEMWVYPTTVTGTFYLCSIGSEAAGRYVVMLVNGVVVTNLYGSGNATLGGSVSATTWTHIAISRSGSTIRGFVNGTVLGTTETNSSSIGNGPLKIASDSSGGNTFNGYIDDFRLTKGLARYTSSFTAPTSALPNK